MRKYLQMGLLSLLLLGATTACEQMSTINAYAFTGKAEENITDGFDREVQAALHKDAQLARRMPLKQYARYMKARHTFYKDYRQQYQDDYVKITINRDKMRIETAKGKVKMEYEGNAAESKP